MKSRSILLTFFLTNIVFFQCASADVEDASESNAETEIGDPFSIPIIEEEVHPFQDEIDLISTPLEESIELSDEIIAPVPDILFTDPDEIGECVEIIMGAGCGEPSVDTDGDGLNDTLDACPTEYGNPVDGCDYSEQYEGEEDIA